jgi:hypothetical protein
MAWMKRKSDPISDRTRVLNSKIAALEAQIQRLDARLQRNQNQPRLRSTAVPHGATITHTTQTAEIVTTTARPEPIFEELGQERLTARPERASTAGHYNDMGVRKYDVPALLGRVREAFRGPTTTNPKLVSYLAAGGVQGLRPLRKEKRIARNRFILFTVFLFFMLLGVIYMFVRVR